jgi:hypothetical protein
MAKRNRDGVSLKDDPRMRDVVSWNRIRDMVFEDAIDRAWGCALYRLNRVGLINSEQREAGDRYWKLIDDYKKTQQIDPDEALDDKDRESKLGRIKKAKDKREEVIELLGGGRMLLDDLILSEVYPTNEREKKLLVAMLEALNIFFSKGTKRKPRIRDIIYEGA